MSRHRHAINVRADGLATVLGPMSRDPAVLVALLVDVDSGMVLDACGPAAEPGGTGSGGTGSGEAADVEELGAAHGELMRLALGAAGAIDDDVEPCVQACEITVALGTRRHVVLRRVADPHGDRLVLSVLIDGPPRAVRRVRRRLGEVSASALTAGPSVTLRPGHGAWAAAGPGAAGHPGVAEYRNGAGDAGARPDTLGGPAPAAAGSGLAGPVEQPDAAGGAGADHGSNGRGHPGTAGASGGPVVPGPRPPDERDGPHPAGPHPRGSRPPGPRPAGFDPAGLRPAGPRPVGSDAAVPDDQRHDLEPNGAERSPAPPSALPPPTRTGA